MTRAVVITLLMLVSWIGGYRWGYAADETRRAMVRVERALVEAGYEAAAGYARLPAPQVDDVDVTPGGVWGFYTLGRIQLSTRQPSGCRAVTLAHEVAHDAAVRMGLLDATPNQDLKAELERLAAVAEAAADADEWSPNCILKRGSL